MAKSSLPALPSIRKVMSERMSTSKSRRRFRPGVRALMEIRKYVYQKSTNFLIPKLPFVRMVKEIIMAHFPGKMRIQLLALEALQEATEMCVVQLF